MWVRLSILVIEDKNWTKKKNIKEICSLLDPWQLQRLMSVEIELRQEKLFCGTFYMNEVFVYNKCPGNVLFTVIAIVFSVVVQAYYYWS